MIGNDFNPAVLQVQETIVPITSVVATSTTQNRVILFAKSSYLCLSLASNVDTQLKVFKHQAIHHIVPSNYDSKLILVGGGRSISLVKQIQDTMFNVIIPEVRLEDWIIAAQWVSLEQITVLFSYNHVSLLDTKLCVLRTVNCNECCIVYGGCFDCRPGLDALACWSGTVFNTILFWKPFSSSIVLKSYSGHKGVIFDVTVSESLVFSVSDDRSMIIWDRETAVCLHKLFGHSARPLKVILLQDESMVATVGEDCRCLLWSIEGGNEPVKELRAHTGNGIRSVSSNNGILVTGGWDGKVFVYNLNKNNSHKHSSLLSSDKMTDEYHHELCLEHGSPRWVVWCDEDHVLVNSSTGYFTLIDLKTKCNQSLHIIESFVFKDYSVCCKFYDFIIIGGIRGQISFFRIKDRSFSHINCPSETKIHSLTRVEHAQSTHNTWFISSQDKGLSTMWSVQDCETLPVFTFSLPPCKNRWITCAALVKEEDNRYLMVGDRKGGVHLYKVSNKNENCKPLFSYQGLHGVHGVTKLFFKDNRFQSFGRDGNTRYYKIADEKLVITCKNKSLSSASWIENIDFLNNYSHVHHFHGSHYKINIPETGQEVFSIDCGGGHRSWDCGVTARAVQFAYIKSSKVYIVSQPYPQNSFQTICHGSHGLDTHCAIISKSDQMISVSEDCDIIIHGSSNESSYCRISNHISSIRTIASSYNYVFTAGGRCSLKAWKISDLDSIDLTSDYNVSSGTAIPVGYNSDYKFDHHNKNNDQRIISIDCCMGSYCSYLIYCGLSNGNTVLLRYDQSKGTFDQLWTKTTANCITKVKISCDERDGDVITLFATTTFGMLHVDVLEKQSHNQITVLSHRQHISAINGFDINVQSSQTDIVTIGDDGNVIASKINTQSGSITQEACTTAHFTAGISVGYVNKTDKLVLSIGSDQRIKILSSSLIALYCCYTDVADPHNLFVQSADHEKLDEITVVVCGKGIQKFILKPNLLQIMDK